MSALSLAATAALVATPLPALARPADPALTPTIAYDLAATPAVTPLLPKGGERLTAYAVQDEASPAPAKKKSKTLLYVGVGVLAVVGLLFIVASNTVVLPDGTIDGA